MSTGNKRRYSTILCCIVTAVLLAGVRRIEATTDPQLSDSPVTATIPEATATPGSDTIAPSIPILVRPVDGAVTGDTTPELVWQRVTDPNSNYVTYTVYLNGTAIYLGISDTGNASAANYTSTVYENEIRTIPTTPLSDGTYSWKVRATDASGNYSESSFWSFTIDTQAPHLAVQQVGTYSNPDIYEGADFALSGPGTVAIEIASDPFVEVRVTVAAPDGETGIHTGTTDAEGHIIFTDYLAIGRYAYQVSATDAANLTSLLPLFTITMGETVIIIPMPGVSPPPVLVIPHVVTQITSSLYNYPATVSQVATRSRVAFQFVYLLAIAIVLLLIILKKRINLHILDTDGTPMREVEVTHTDSDGRTTQYDCAPLNRGRLYVRGLTTRSRLTIKYRGQTLDLCISRPQRVYTVQTI